MTELETLKERLEKASKEQNEAWNNTPDGLSYTEYCKYLEPFTDKVESISNEYRYKIDKYELSKIPKYGDKMTLQEFVGYCECGGFIDYDGSGNYSDGKKESDIAIYPSDITKYKRYRTDFTHVIWYNR